MNTEIRVFHQYSSIIRKVILTVFFLWLSSLLLSCDSEQNKEVTGLDDRVSDEELRELQNKEKKQAENVLYFGFDLRSSPQEDSRQYQPFLSYLEKATGYKFELRFTPDNKSIIDQLGTGKVHFAAIGAVSYIRGHEKYGIITLVRGLNHQGKAKYRSMIVVKPDSSIKNVSELKNRRFAFGSAESTQGHLIPRIILHEHGVHLSDLGSYEYTGSHQDCAEAVISSKFDACGMQDTMAKNMEEQGVLKILHESRYYPSSGVAVYQGVSPEIVSRVKQALINFDPKVKHIDGLYHWSRTEMPNGFTHAEDKDYRELKEWLVNLNL